MEDIKDIGAGAGVADLTTGGTDTYPLYEADLLVRSGADCVDKLKLILKRDCILLYNI
jgi:hypothetical protein